MDSAYSPLKPAWHLDRIESLRKGRIPAPVHVQLILSDLCNQDCGFCAYRMSEGLSRELFGTAETHNPNRKMPTAKALEIIAECAEIGVKAMQFTGGGEPTVHPDHEMLFGAAVDVGLETGLVTNGVKLNVRAPSVLAMKWIRISVDAGTPETYSSVRHVSPLHWQRVWQNITALAKTYRGRLGVGFVVTPENYREIRQCAELCEAAGVDNLRIGAVFSELGTNYYGDLLPSIQESIASVPRDGQLKVVDMFGRRMDDLWSGSPRGSFCGYQHFNTYIGADLNVYRCCNTAYTTRGTIGNLAKQSLQDLFDDGSAYRKFDARGCKFCQFRRQNDVISELVFEPHDVNFV